MQPCIRKSSHLVQHFQIDCASRKTRTLTKSSFQLFVPGSPAGRQTRFHCAFLSLHHARGGIRVSILALRSPGAYFCPIGATKPIQKESLAYHSRAITRRFCRRPTQVGRLKFLWDKKIPRYSTLVKYRGIPACSDRMIYASGSVGGFFLS